MCKAYIITTAKVHQIEGGGGGGEDSMPSKATKATGKIGDVQN